ncbi:DNA/RNA polymerase, partial [Ramicandelaber brevisporus]
VREYPSGIVPMASIEPIKLEVLDGAYEVYRSQYPLSVAQKAERERIIGEGLKYGTWTKSTSHSLTPVLLVPKKNTDRMRLVQDNRQCNELCVSYAADMPNLGSLHAHLMNAKAVSKVDIASAFTSV